MERIIASALNIKGAIVVGKRHWDCIKSAIESWIWKAPIKCSVQWFYTSEFRFIDREKAYTLAKKNWQFKWERENGILFSEDLR